MSFLTIIILGVITLQSSNMAMMNRQNNEIQAHFLANQGLKIVEAIGYTTLIANCPSKTCKIKPDGMDYDVENEVSNPEEINGLFSRSFTLDSNDLTDAFKTEMKISWTDSTGKHEVTAKRIIFLIAE